MQTWQKIKDNPDLKEKYFVREKVTDTIRSFFKTLGFHEVSTPILVPVPSCEPNLEVFETQLRTSKGVKRRGYLIMSPEYSCKKLLAAGIGNLFEITKTFRNEEEVSTYHNPEFTMLEWYRINASYTEVMKDFEELFIAIINNTQPHTRLDRWEYQKEKYNITPPWPRISVVEAFRKYCGIQRTTLLSNKLFKHAAEKKGYAINSRTPWEQVFYQMFFNEIEPKLKASHKPVFIYDYPLSQAALARKKSDDPQIAERFEVFLAGIELGNCFSELTQAGEQRRRFIKEINERKVSGKTKFPIDIDLINALKAGIPDTAGIAVGVDRLVMLAQDTDQISDTLYFPAKEMFKL